VRLRPHPGSSPSTTRAEAAHRSCGLSGGSVAAARIRRNSRGL
jgi:hypothetical protein